MTPRRTKKYCDRLIIIYRRVSRAVWKPRAKEKFLYPAYQLRDTSHRDLVKGAKTGSRSSLTKRFDGCLMHNKGAFTSFSNLCRTTPRFISRRTASDLQSNMIFSVYRSYYHLLGSSRRSEGNGDLKNEYERERKEEIMSRTWSNRQDRKCALSTPIIGTYPFPRSFFFWLNRSREGERGGKSEKLHFYIPTSLG